MEKTRINKVNEEAIRMAIREMFKDTGVSIYSDFGFDKETVTWEVSWSSIGSVDSDRAKKMAQSLEKAARVVEYLNELNMVFTYEDDEIIKSLLDAKKVEKARQEMKDRTILIGWLINAKNKKFWANLQYEAE